jgi:hypothetical protein
MQRPPPGASRDCSKVAMLQSDRGKATFLQTPAAHRSHAV